MVNCLIAQFNTKPIDYIVFLRFKNLILNLIATRFIVCFLYLQIFAFIVCEIKCFPI